MATAKDDKIPYLIDDTSANVALGLGATSAGLGVLLAKEQKKADIKAAQGQAKRIENIRGPNNQFDGDVTLKQAIKLTDNQKWVEEAMKKAQKASGLSDADWGKLSRSEKLDAVWRSEPNLRARYDAEFQTNVGRAQKALETSSANTQATVARQNARGILNRQIAPTLTKTLRDSPLGLLNRGGDALERVVTGAVKGNSTGAVRGFTAAGAGKLAGGVVKGIPAYLADVGLNAAFRPDEQERIDAVHAKLQKAGYNVSKEEVAKSFGIVGDVWRDQGAWFGLGKGRMNQFWAGEGAGRLAAALYTGGASELAQPFRVLQQAGAEGSADDAIASAIMADMQRRQFVERKSANMGSDIATGLYGDLISSDKSVVAQMANAFGAPTGVIPKAPPRNAFKAEQEALYSTQDPSTRFLQSGAAERGGKQFYEDVYSQLPFFADKDGNFVVRGTGVEDVAPQYIDPKMARAAYDAVLANAGVITQQELYQRSFGTDMPQAVVANANQPTQEQKLPSGGGMREVTSTSTLPAPRLAPPSSPEEVNNNIITGGVARGLSPQAAIMENYINKSGRKTAEQRDAEIAAALQDPNSAFSQAARRNYAGAQANMPYAPVPESQLKGRTQGDAYAMKLLLRGDITPDQMPNQYGNYIDRELKGEAPMHGLNEAAYMGQARNTGFYDSREANRARGTDQLFNYFTNVAESNRLNRRQKLGMTPTTQAPDLLKGITPVPNPNGNMRSEGYGMDGYSWEPNLRKTR